MSSARPASSEAPARIGLFGGSFDPIHRGHVEPVLAARRELGLERVIYLPTARPPHKPERRFAPAWSRFAMVELALLQYPELVVSTHELTLGRPAYTVETLEHFREHFREGGTPVELHLLIGADSYNELDQWVRWRDILRLATLVVLARPGEESAAHLPPELRSPGPESVRKVENAPLPYSSTEIRARLARGDEPPAGALDAAVLNYCRKYRLYQPERS